MFARLKKLIIIGVLSISTISSNTVVFASDTSASISEALDTEESIQDTETDISEPEIPEESNEPEITPPETDLPETDPPETDPPETVLPETDPPETDYPEPTQPVPPQEEVNGQETEDILVEETDVPLSKPEETENETDEPEIETDTSETDQITDQDETIDYMSDSERSLQEGIANSPYSTNDDLVAHQKIVHVPIKKEFRFSHVDAKKAILKAGCNIYEEKNRDSRRVGRTDNNCYVDIIADEASEWIFIESGDVRGFANKNDILCGEAIELIASRNPSTLCAEVLVPATDNAAICYTYTTAKNPVAEKVYGIAKCRTNVYDSEYMQDASIVGILENDSYLAYILAETDNCYFIESGDVRGFVSKSSLADSAYSEIKVSQMSESSFSTATEIISPENNKACYYTLTSTKPANKGSAERNAIVEFACQFVGNPYVWGGTSLTNGADCSGFVQSVYANYGYSIPRVACDQALYGTQIPIQDAEPGDLIFYAKQGYVYHVSMYIGNGRVVQAYSTKAGIITSEIGPNAVWATKIIR